MHLHHNDEENSEAARDAAAILIQRLWRNNRKNIAREEHLDAEVRWRDTTTHARLKVRHILWQAPRHQLHSVIMYRLTCSLCFFMALHLSSLGEPRRSSQWREHSKAALATRGSLRGTVAGQECHAQGGGVGYRCRGEVSGDAALAGAY